MMTTEPTLEQILADTIVQPAMARDKLITGKLRLTVHEARVKNRHGSDLIERAAGVPSRHSASRSMLNATRDLLSARERSNTRQKDLHRRADSFLGLFVRWRRTQPENNLQM